MWFTISSPDDSRLLTLRMKAPQGVTLTFFAEQVSMWKKIVLYHFETAVEEGTG
jgi:hypothetical protein